MKKYLVFPVLAIFSVILLANPALAREISIKNGCGFTIAALSLSDTNSNEAQDLLGNEVLGANQSVRVNLQGGDSGWDLIAVDEEGGNVAFQNLNLSGVSSVTLFADGTAELR